ncbi:SWI/SNF-related matrix-associated actin-dependent regulator of chromatin subfamily A-like protein 1 [Linepithema humile]|uniref:SWI/SNF-related matrix-associated actin-dependent regulator of chromatin subfamily A-like protein 1 n=1 Tax=Linepithema humile TaxID=83485 RepID=UPI0006234133|nr:PREDICTED: SWI/SNF-related matrix-associated actin-dependent regulator of chromatin subfamily A-like protein 1 [Linepithema humile]XP_012215898.1 PREDICTED: SWI/SNF-related matrix-associated actin-dependent regulator of chromatin subfamily A-like protein 1 [Linepithema humile]
MDKMDKVCSPEEIEKKRLLALQKRQFKQAQLKNLNIPTNSSASQSPRQIPQESKYKDSTNVMRQNKSNNRFNPIEPKKFFNLTSIVTGKCRMISNDRFALETSAFVPEIIATFKTVPSRAYDVNSKVWNFHLNDYDNLIQKLVRHDPMISVAKIPEDILQTFKKSLNSDNQVSNLDLSKIDDKLREVLMPFQEDGVRYGISKNGHCMIADDMGLGKTLQALGIAHYFRESWPLLIVTPSSVKCHWSEAIYKFLPSIPVHYVHHFANARDHIKDDKITIITYDLLVRAINILERYIYGCVILDESHVLKSITTARFKAVKKICARARHIILLTGTPALSRPIELYSQISLILNKFMSYENYGIRYCAGKKNLFGWDFTGSSNLEELQLFLKTTCMIRRLKADVLSQLSSKTRQVIMLDPDLIKASTKQMENISKQLQKKTGFEKHTALLEYYNQSSFARLKAVCNYVTKLFEKKKKCLLFAHHQNVLDAMCNVAESMKIRYIRIDGKTNPERRKVLVDTFQERDDYLAAVLSITAANAGITLTAAHLVVFAELFWNPGILCQAEDRVHRIGQNNEVLIQYLVAKDTADDYIWPLIQRKMNILNAVGLDQDFSIDNVDVNEQKEIGQLDLTSFINISPFSEEQLQSQHDKEQNDFLHLIDNKEQKDSSPKASTSNNFKELLEDDEEYFSSCNWDDMI